MEDTQLVELDNGEYKFEFQATPRETREIINTISEILRWGNGPRFVKSALKTYHPQHKIKTTWRAS